MLRISSHMIIPAEEIHMSAIRAQGAGGQNVNKVSSAIHLRFDIRASSLPEFYKQALLKMNDHRITRDGIIIIKAQQFRTQESNREDALERLRILIKGAGIVQKVRRPTKPTKSSKKKRLDGKTKHSRKKTMRRKDNYLSD